MVPDERASEGFEGIVDNVDESDPIRKPDAVLELVPGRKASEVFQGIVDKIDVLTTC